MLSRRQVLLCCGVVCALAAAGLWVGHDGPPADGEGPAGLFDGLSQLAREGWRGRDMDRLLHVVTRCDEGKRRVVGRLLEQRLTLFEAAACFRAVDADRPPQVRVHLEVYPGDADEERLCWYVIRCAEAFLEEKGQDAGPVVSRLRAELRDHLARHGGVCLPEPPRD
jgi:hypothetical protein